MISEGRLRWIQIYLHDTLLCELQVRLQAQGDASSSKHIPASKSNLTTMIQNEGVSEQGPHLFFLNVSVIFQLPKLLSDPTS